MQYEYWYQYTIFLKKIKAKNYIIKLYYYYYLMPPEQQETTVWTAP